MKIILTTIIKNWKSILLGILAILWLYTCEQYKIQKTKADRQTENVRQNTIKDSTDYNHQNLTAEELLTYLEYNNKDILKKLASERIRTSRLEKVITNNHFYRDTIQSNINMDSIIQAIKNDIPRSQSFIDSTNCMKIKGQMVYDGKSLRLLIDEKEYKNKNDLAVYWERRQWKFLGMKTRIFGRKQFNAKVFDDCGKSEIIEIEKIKK